MLLSMLKLELDDRKSPKDETRVTFKPVMLWQHRNVYANDQNNFYSQDLHDSSFHHCHRMSKTTGA